MPRKLGDAHASMDCAIPVSGLDPYLVTQTDMECLLSAEITFTWPQIQTSASRSMQSKGRVINHRPNQTHCSSGSNKAVKLAGRPFKATPQRVLIRMRVSGPVSTSKSYAYGTPTSVIRHPRPLRVGNQFRVMGNEPIDHPVKENQWVRQMSKRRQEKKRPTQVI